MIKANNIWISCIIVFVASACSLIIELVAGRIMAPYVGVSLYTWTSIIGIVLAGISLGNFLGGQVADRWGSRRTLGVLLFVSAFLSLTILVAVKALDGLPFTLPLMTKILFLTAVIFFPPSCLLGTISPVVVKLTLENLEKVGNTVGKIYAVSALGSIVGTFLTGFVLISMFGTRTIVFVVALILAAMALIFGQWSRKRPDLAILSGLLLIFAGYAGYLYNDGSLRSPYLMETNYYSIRVGETAMPDSTTRKELILDHLIHSYAWVDDPTRLEYGYEKIYAEVTRYITQAHPAIKAAFIGGGGYTFPRYIEATYPNSQIDVAEIDPGVTQTAYSYLGLRANTKVKTFNEDARLFFDDVNRVAGPKYDLIMGDAFNDLSLPYHLTTMEFNQKIKQAIEPDGFYMVNVIDNYKTGEFMRAYMNTLQRTFPYIYLVGLGPAWDWEGSSTYVVLGGNQPLDVDQYQAAASENNAIQLTGVIMPNGQLQSYLKQNLESSLHFSIGDLQASLAITRPPIVLTDDYAPVDNLMAPRFVERGY